MSSHSWPLFASRTATACRSAPTRHSDSRLGVEVPAGLALRKSTRSTRMVTYARPNKSSSRAAAALAHPCAPLHSGSCPSQFDRELLHSFSGRDPASLRRFQGLDDEG